MRFHYPDVYGDYLGDVRPSLKQAKERKEQVLGFEIGKVFSGFRNVFPIYIDGDFYGTVEFSQPYKTLENKMKNILDSYNYMFVINKEKVFESVFEERKDFYEASCFSDDWVVEKSDTSMCSEMEAPEALKKTLSAMFKNDEGFQRDLKKGIGVSKAFKTEQGYYSITAIPIFDTTDQLAAEVVSVIKAPFLDNIYGDFYGHVAVFGAVLIFITFLLYMMIRGENILREQDARKSLIYDSMGEGLYVMDEKGQITTINNAALMGLGYEKDEIMGKVAHEIFHVHDRHTPLGECPIYEGVSRDGSYIGVQRFKKKNGEIFYADVVSKRFNEVADSYSSVTLFRDITEKINSEEALKRANEQLELFNEQLSQRAEEEVASRLNAERSFKTVFENAPESICVIDEKHVIRECNDQTAKMLGYEDKVSIVGHTPDDFIVQESDAMPNGRKMIEDVFKRVFSGEAVEVESSMRRKDGEILRVQHLVSPIRRSSEKEAISISRDITEIVRLKKEREAHQSMLIQQSKLAELGNMMGIIAHQWKQPLNAISMLASMLIELQEDGDLDEKSLKESVDNIIAQAIFLSHTIDDFRNFYKPSRNLQKFDMSVEVQKVIDLVSAKMRREGIIIENDMKSGLYVDGYMGEFKQVVLNLINNATDQLIEKGVDAKNIKISASERDGFAILSISDNGGGIPKEVLGHIFEPFFSTKGESGTGIGLNLARTIIEEKMGGKIKASNSEVGAVFEVRLPLSNA